MIDTEDAPQVEDKPQEIAVKPTRAWLRKQHVKHKSTYKGTVGNRSAALFQCVRCALLFVGPASNRCQCKAAVKSRRG